MTSANLLAREFGLPEVTREAVYVGDSKGDIICAAAAGVKSFAVTTGGHERAELNALGAWRVGENLADLLEIFPVFFK